MVAGLDLHAAACLLHAFVESHDSDSEVGVGIAHMFDNLMGHATAAVSDFDHQFRWRLPKDNSRARAAGMAMNVCETLLDKAKRCGFQISRATPS